MNSRFLFRCDCDSRTGFGHFSRCLNLARQVRRRARSARIAFWGNYDRFGSSLLERYGFPSLPAPASGYAGRDAQAAIAASSGFDAMVVDSYRLSQAYVRRLSGRACRLAVIDDMRVLDLSGADLVIAFRAGSESVAYGARNAALGPAHLIVKPELRRIRVRNLAATRWTVRRVLVFISGRTAGGVLLAKAVAATITALPAAEVSYITEDGRAIKGVARARPKAQTPEMEKLYARADLVITGGGLAKYESAYCGIPNAALSQTALQHQDTRLLARRGLTLDLGMAAAFDHARVAGRLAGLARSAAALRAQRRAFRAQFDTDSGPRLAARLLALT